MTTISATTTPIVRRRRELFLAGARKNRWKWSESGEWRAPMVIAAEMRQLQLAWEWTDWCQWQFCSDENAAKSVGVLTDYGRSDGHAGVRLAISRWIMGFLIVVMAVKLVIESENRVYTRQLHDSDSVRWNMEFLSRYYLRYGGDFTWL